MYPNYNYYPQQVPQTPNYVRPQATYPVALKGRPVSSFEEARVSSIDFDGSIFYFPDLANRKIYTKQINIDGTATLNVYEIKEVPQEMPPAANYITREEFETVINQLKATLTQPTPSIVEHNNEIKTFN